MGLKFLNVSLDTAKNSELEDRSKKKKKKTTEQREKDDKYEKDIGGYTARI